MGEQTFSRVAYNTTMRSVPSDRVTRRAEQEARVTGKLDPLVDPAGFDLIPETLSVTSGAGGTLTSSPSGISCNAATCTHDFGYGTVVTLTATPDTGHALALWSGACSNVPATTPTCTVTMDQAQTVTVRWMPLQYNLSLSILGDTQGSVTVNGTSYSATTTIPVSYGQTLDMTAAVSPLTSGIFYGWGGACASQGSTASCTLTVTGNLSVSATFLQSGYRYIVKATTQTPNGIAFQVTYPASNTINQECTSSTTGTSCSGSLDTGTVVTLVAHLPTATSFQPVWNNLPTWTGCDTVSTDRLKCTFTHLSFRTVTVTGDVRVGP